jgi:hypothetical protein
LFGAAFAAQQHLALHGKVHRLQPVLVGQQSNQVALKALPR